MSYLTQDSQQEKNARLK